MATEPLTIAVDAEAARAFRDASPEEQRKLEMLLSLRLIEATSASTPALRDLIAQISRNAQQRGLTPEVLQTLLDEP